MRERLVRALASSGMPRLRSAVRHNLHRDGARGRRAVEERTGERG